MSRAAFLFALLGAVPMTGCEPPTLLGDDGTRALLASPAAPPVPESDVAVTRELELASPEGVTSLGPARAALLVDEGVLMVDPAERLVHLREGTLRVLLEGVDGAPAQLPDGSFVVTRVFAPGESDLYWVRLDDSPRRLTTMPGAEGQPFVLDDGRLLFVADEGGVVGLYLLELATGVTRRLTNQEERVGALSSRFVPVPVRALRQEGEVVVYDAGAGELWAVNLSTGEAEVRR